MTTSLQSLQHIQIITLVRWTIAEYRTQPSDFPNVQTLRFNDSIRNIPATEGGASVTYTGLGGLLSYTRTKESVRSTGDKFAIGIAGIPQSETRTILASGIKGSQIEVFRLLQYPGTNNNIDDLDFARGATGGIVGRFAGFVNTYSIQDDIQHETDTRTVEIVLDCLNFAGILTKLTKGLRTNPQDLRFITSNTDPSFDNVPALNKAQWYFGSRS